MFKKQKSITVSNSTSVKYKITCAKNNHKVVRNEFVEFQFVNTDKHYFCVIKLIFSFVSRSGGVTAEMDPTGSVAAVDAALERLNKQRLELEQLWATRKLKLDLCLRLRIFERDALEVRKIMLKRNGFIIILTNHLYEWNPLLLLVNPIVLSYYIICYSYI